MGCGSSSSTAVVRPLVPGNLKGDECETESKHSCRGDSAVSKITTDSGVGMENREVPALPGAVPRRLPPLSASVSPPLLRRDSQSQGRRKSCEILEELLTQGIIPTGRESSGTAGEAYSIMLTEGEGAFRRPPARLESLKEKKIQLSKEEIDEKIRLAEERRKQKEEEMKTRLRAKSARVRVRTQSTGEEEDPVELLSAPMQAPMQAPIQAPIQAPTQAPIQAPTQAPIQAPTQSPQASGQDVETQVVPITQDGELSDSADSDVSFTPVTSHDEVF